MIKVIGLTKYYGNKPAAKDISFEVQKGEVFGLLGTNGAGKSTTIKMLCGLLKPTRGSIKIGEVDLQPCGGTHVKSTIEIGKIQIGKIENKGKINRRVNL